MRSRRAPEAAGAAGGDVAPPAAVDDSTAVREASEEAERDSAVSGEVEVTVPYVGPGAVRRLAVPFASPSEPRGEAEGARMCAWVPVPFVCLRC